MPRCKCDLCSQRFFIKLKRIDVLRQLHPKDKSARGTGEAHARWKIPNDRAGHQLDIPCIFTADAPQVMVVAAALDKVRDGVLWKCWRRCVDRELQPFQFSFESSGGDGTNPQTGADMSITKPFLSKDLHTSGRFSPK